MMQLQLGISNSLKSLARHLSKEIQSAQSVFKPIYIVTQTAGMNIWLKQFLAQELGIAANIQFLKPNDAIHLIFRKLSGRYKYQSISAHDLNWLIYDILREEGFKNQFPKIYEYYNQEGLEGDIKRMALAEKIADLFDQYQVYRAHEMDRWSHGENWESLQNLPHENDQAWQKYIWQRAAERAGENFSDKTYIGKYILAELDKPEQIQKLQQEIPGLYFFGLSLITAYHLQIIYKVAQYSKVQFLFQNPAPQTYWYDDKTEKLVDFLKHIEKFDASEKSLANPLLVSWGKLVQNTFKMFFADDDILNSFQEIHIQEPAQDTLLHTLQHSIFTNEKEEIHFSHQQLTDGSLTINSCYNPIREVEVLYNYLVHLVDQKKEELSARDIIVMVSDIDLYSSYIKAVFDNAPQRFNYTIADESYLMSDTIHNALTALLSISESSFTSEKVLGLLEFSAIRRHFKIDDLELIRKIINQANIRFGISGNQSDDSYLVSWTYGLKRMMYGLCMRGDEEYITPSEGFYPLDNVEGNDSFKIVRFTYFVENLIDIIQQRSRKRSIADWVSYVEDCIYRFIGEIEENPEEDYVLLQNKLEQYNRLEDLYEDQVGFEVFRYNFLPGLAGERRSSNFASHGITFCSLIPMRSIPFKVVALLGVDLGKFPRIQRPVSFDLMEKKRQAGDRDLKENDKQLFLDTLLSAEDYFYLSYIGQSVKDNESIPPSALVDELVDFISSQSEHSDEVRKHFIQKHPLHGFSKKYNTATHPEMYSYLIPKTDSLQKDLEEEPHTDFDFSEIDLYRFIAFLKNPVKAYYNSILNVYLENENKSISETEKFDLDPLEKWQIKDDLIKASHLQLETYIDRQKKLGRLPLKNMASVVTVDLQEEIQQLSENYQNLIGQKEAEKYELHLHLENSLFTGKITDIYDGNLIRFTVSKNIKKYVLTARIEQLFLNASGLSYPLYFLDKNGQAEVYKAFGEAAAQQLLTTLLSLYKKGHYEILPFHFRFYFKPKNGEGAADITYEAFLKEVKKYFESDNYQKPDAYLEKEYQRSAFKHATTFEEFKSIYMLYYQLIEGEG